MDECSNTQCLRRQHEIDHIEIIGQYVRIHSASNSRRVEIRDGGKQYFEALNMEKIKNTLRMRSKMIITATRSSNMLRKLLVEIALNAVDDLEVHRLMKT